MNNDGVNSVSTLENKLEYSSSPVRNYLVDTTAAWAFYTPIMAASEAFIAGMSSKEVLKSRLTAAFVNAIYMRPYGKFREWWAKKCNATPESSKIKKAFVDTSAMVIGHTPVYTGILYLSGASLDEILVALPAGLTIGALSGRPYGFVLDKWRKLWGTKPTLDR